jgi:ribosome maturation factor RimP
VSAGREGQTVTDEIEAACMPVVRAHGVSLVDLEVHGGGRRCVVRFFVDKPGGVTVSDLKRLSEELGDVLEVADVLPGSYDLEVSSPGLDRELRKDRELRWALGKRVRVWMREPVDGERELSGQLIEVGDADLTLLQARGPVTGPRRIPRAWLAKVRLDLVGRSSP